MHEGIIVYSARHTCIMQHNINSRPICPVHRVSYMHISVYCSPVYFHKVLRNPYSRQISNAEVRALSWCPPISNMVMEYCLRFSAPNEDHHRAVAAAIHKLPTDWKWPQEDPITHGSEPLSLIWVHWTSVLSTWGRQPQENLGIQLWTWLRLRRVCRE